MPSRGLVRRDLRVVRAGVGELARARGFSRRGGLHVDRRHGDRSGHGAHVAAAPGPAGLRESGLPLEGSARVLPRARPRWFPDWRLPSIVELVSLLDFSVEVYLDQTAFPGESNRGWSASCVAPNPSGSAASGCAVASQSPGTSIRTERSSERSGSTPKSSCAVFVELRVGQAHPLGGWAFEPGLPITSLGPSAPGLAMQGAEQ